MADSAAVAITVASESDQDWPVKRNRKSRKVAIGQINTLMRDVKDIASEWKNGVSSTLKHKEMQNIKIEYLYIYMPQYFRMHLQTRQHGTKKGLIVRI